MNSRTAFTLRAFIARDLREQGYAIKEVGQILSVTPEGARRLIARAVRLRSRFAKPCKGCPTAL